MQISQAQLRKCKRLAIMGGTFDPIHYGHLVTAEAVRTEFAADCVLFIPTGQPPHKSDNAVTDNEHRYLMTVLATVGNPYFYTSRMEIDRPGRTYTIDTIRALRRICRKDTELYFITGADAVAEIFTWKEADKLLELCHFVAVTRPGYRTDNLMADIQAIDEKYAARLHFLEVPALAISSSDIRKRCARSKAVKYLLPEVVETYMTKHQLYEADRFEAYLMERLSPRRLAHTMAVAETAVKLAAAYGYDTEKARQAALLHDCAKELSSEESLDLCRRYGIVPDAYEARNIKLLHAVLGAAIAEADFGIDDADILNAIRYHTTARPAMDTLEKIIYLADLIEPTREEYPHLDTLCKLAYENIDAAVLLGLQCKANDVRAKELSVHPTAAAAQRFYSCSGQNELAIYSKTEG